MKRFKFRLEKVLQLRDSIKDERKRELMLANMQLRVEEEKLEALQGELAVAAVETREIRSEDLYLLERYRIRVSEQIETQLVTIEQARQAVEVALQAYLEAAKDAKSLHMLRDRRKVEYMEEVAKEEGRFLDEIATQRVKRH